MKTRTALLIACMLFVPAAAMFSHRIPPGLRTAARKGISAAVAWCMETARPSAREQPVEPQAPQRDVPAAPTAVVLATPPASSLTAPAEQSQPAVAAGDRFDPQLPRASAVGDSLSPADEQFARLGATGVECRTLRGVEGVHVASCSVVLDASGQLVRVFQASGPDPSAARRSLLDDVTAWRQRIASRVGQDGPPAGRPADHGQQF